MRVDVSYPVLGDVLHLGVQVVDLALHLLFLLLNPRIPQHAYYIVVNINILFIPKIH